MNQDLRNEVLATLQVRFDQQLHDDFIVDGNSTFTGFGNLGLDFSGLINSSEVELHHTKTEAMIKTDGPEGVIGGCQPDSLALFLMGSLDGVEH